MLYSSLQYYLYVMAQIVMSAKRTSRDLTMTFVPARAHANTAYQIVDVGIGYMEKGKDSATPDPEGHMTLTKRRKRAERKRAYKKKHRTMQRPGRTERLTRDVQRKTPRLL